MKSENEKLDCDSIYHKDYKIEDIGNSCAVFDLKQSAVAKDLTGCYIYVESNG